jgi:hypothetical protein
MSGRRIVNERRRASVRHVSGINMCVRRGTSAWTPDAGGFYVTIRRLIIPPFIPKVFS